MNITFEGKKCERKTTNKLQPGDVIQHGNVVVGFWYTLVTKVERSKYNKHKSSVTYIYDFLAPHTEDFGFGSVFYVVKDVQE